MLKKVRARRAAERLLKQFKIKKPPVDVWKIAKQLPRKEMEQLKNLSLSVQKRAFPPDLDDVSAVLLKEKAQAVIAVNTAHSEYRQRFSIAHELGHLILHSDNELLTVEKKVEQQLFTRAESVHNIDEMEANEFAAVLLMPEDLITKDFKKLFEKDSDEIISKLAKRYEVSQPALTYRLKNMGLL
jgi:Zn-dependent peptidase ImmA (M78 family)